ncbi:MAG: hypothetical protein WCS99_05675 [Limisphaerales bacterium]
MKRSLIILLALGPALVVATAGSAGHESSGNTDGLLTWQLGDLAAGQSAREVALFAHGKTAPDVAGLLTQARAQFARMPEPAAGVPGSAAGTVWIRNGVTDFALQGPGHFFWEGGRQSLTGERGGQLSRFGYFVHYNDRQAGTPISGNGTPENLRVVEPLHLTGDGQAVVVVETRDGQLRLRLRTAMGTGAVAAVEFIALNSGSGPLRGVRLTAYANLEAAHDHENDFSALDARTGALLTVDVPTGICVAMAGLGRPASGHSGNWPSKEQLRDGAGVPLAGWKPFAGPPAAVTKVLSPPKPARGTFENYAPAPPVAPVEPATRTLSAADADGVLRDDWLFQAEGRPLAKRAEQELRWARDLAARLTHGTRAPDLSGDLGELNALERKLAALKNPDDSPSGRDAAREVYESIRKVKRRIQFKNPVVDFTQVLLVDNPYPAGREWQHQVRHRNGMMAVPGGRLLVLDGLHPGGRVRKLAPDRPASFWRPDLSFDAQRVLFCMKRHDEPAFHLYEINLDGTGLRQITDGPYDDLDPIYLPSDRIMFSSTRGNTFIRCMPYTYSYILARCDLDGRNLYLVSTASEPEWLPALLHDGRVIFSRWDYIDKALWRIQSLWTARQDGTRVETFWGNQSVWPDHLAGARPIPGSDRVMFMGVAHHDWFAGSVGILDPNKGRNFPHGLTKVTADVAWPESGPPPLDPVEAADYHTAGKFDAWQTPFPLSEEDFLASARRDGKFRLYLMDVHGNRELIYEGAHHVWHAMPVKPRVPPPAHSDLVAWPDSGKDRKPPEPGVFYSANVTQGVPDLPPGRVKFLRVLQMDHKTYSLWGRDARNSGPAVSPLQDDGVKRILGTVPIEADGSVYFKAPPGVILYFQLLDEHQRALHTMRSSTGLMPGERRSCIGCHEQHTTAPVNATGLALRHEPRELTLPPWGTASVGYERLVQPVLDRHCGKCHSGDGDGRSKIDLTLRPGNGVFKEPYLTLIGAIGFGLNKQSHPPGLAGALMCENFAQSDPDSYVTLRPMQYLSYTSPLINLCMGEKHYGVKLPPADLQTLIGWVDANCPYRGDEEMRAIPDPLFSGIEKLPVRPRTQTAPVISRP